MKTQNINLSFFQTQDFVFDIGMAF